MRGGRRRSVPAPVESINRASAPIQKIAVDLIVAELAAMRPDWRLALRQCHPGSKQTCDLLWGEPPQWAIEIKMFRPHRRQRQGR
jgi:hypothetical protein